MHLFLRCVASHECSLFLYTRRVHLLLRHGVTPYLVFDGGHLPAKAGKEVERRTKREASMQRGMQLLREGNSSGAHQFFCKAADVTPFMAHQLIQACMNGTAKLYSGAGGEGGFVYSDPERVVSETPPKAL